MRKLHGDGSWSLADHLLAVFAQLHRWPTSDTKFLDLGCGAGGLVYELRSRGIDAYGFDIHDRVAYKHPDDRRFFGFFENPQADTSNAIVAPEIFKVPFGDNSFDVVFSTSVLEHVMDLRTTMSEMARLVKPEGFTFHVYPKKTIPIEPHVYVPLGARFQQWWYFYLWGLLGVRNEYQGHMSAREVADNNVLYAKTGLKYLTDKELAAICGEFFNDVRFVENRFYYDAGPALPHRIKALKAHFPLRALSQTQRLGALFTAQKRVFLPRVEGEGSATRT